MNALLDRLRAVTPPRPVLDREREQRLSDRQREVLDELERMFAHGFATLTMAEIAARANCSLRTLYGLAPSRDELVLVVIDRSLWRVGRDARDAIADHMDPLDAVQAYLQTASVAVGGITAELSRDLAAMPATQRLWLDHSSYLVMVTKSMLDLAVEDGTIDDLDTAAVAQVLANLGLLLSGPTVIPLLRSPPKDAADDVLEIIVRALRSTGDGEASRRR